METTYRKIEQMLINYANNPKSCGYESAFGKASCTYLTSDGRKCVVGQMLDPSYARHKEVVKESQGVVYILLKYGIEILLPEFRELPIQALKEIQAIHDSVARVNYSLARMTLNRLERESGYKFPELREALIAAI